MRQSPLDLLFLVKKSLIGLGVALLAMLAMNSIVLAATPVDIFQDMESGNAGDLLTPAIMNASTHGGSSYWTITNNMWVSTNYSRNLPAPVLVGGVTYNGTGGTRTWMFNENNTSNYVQLHINGSHYSNVTVACYFTTTSTLAQGKQYDTIILWGNHAFAVMQIANPDGASAYVRAHGASSLGVGFGPYLPLTAGKTYWVNVHYDGLAGWSRVAAFDPDNSFSLVGTSDTPAWPGDVIATHIDMGRADPHGDWTPETKQSWFDNVVVDYTNGAYPLIPNNTDSTAPSAPPAVRDGTAADIATSYSTTQLAANWDASTDNQSGIMNYQYAIGTTQGGTQTVNWTTMPNMPGITRAGLSLTVGQTYYFSVRAVNCAGLVGNATNSNGQTVQNPTPTTYFADNFENWTVHGGAWTSVTGESGSETLDTSTDHAKAGTKGLKLTSTNTAAGNGGYLTEILSSLVTGDIYVRFYIFFPTGSESTLGQIRPMWILCPNSNGAGNFIWSMMSFVNGRPQLIAISQITGVWNLSAAGAALSENAWHCIEVHMPPPTPNATCEFWVDGVWSSSTTDNMYGTYGYQTIEFGNVGLVAPTTGTYYLDELVASNVYNGPLGSDATPPSAPPAVRDGTGTDISTTSSTTQLSANWDASTDNESGISGYQYAIGTSAGGTQTVNWTSLGNVTTVTKTGLTLTVGQTYFFSVKAINGVGLTGSATNSNGQTVTGDTTPPSAPPAVRDGTGADISTTSSTTQLSANWDASTDNESGISGYQYAIGTSAGGTQTVNWTSLGNVTTVTKTGLTLTVGQTYFFSVKAINGVGLTGSATNSNGQTVVSVSSVVYFQDNFESWTVHGGAWSSVNGESSNHTLDTSVEYAKAGAKCLKITDSDTTATSGASLTKNFSPVISTDIYVRFFIFLPTGWGSANSNCARRILRVYTDTSNYTVLTLTGDSLAVYEVGGWSGTGVTAVSENAWHCIEVHVAPPSASTAIQYWIDGTSAGTCTGAFSGSSTFNYIQFGDVVLASGTVNGTGTIYWDEVVVSNSYIGTGITSPVTYFSDNFESWAVHGGAWSSVTGESSTHTLNTSTDFARSGTKSLKLTDTDSTAAPGAFLSKTFSPTIAGDVYARFYLYLPTGYESANAGANRRLYRIWCGTARAEFVIRGGITCVDESVDFRNFMGPTISENAWHCIEMHVTAPATTTVMELWVDGVLASNALTVGFSGSVWDHIDLGDTSFGSGNIGDGTFYIDEFVAANSYNGPLP